MCSINEIEQTGDSIKSKKGAKRRDKGNSKNFVEEGLCMKCGEKAAVLVRNNDPFCTTCFLDYIVHKFRATIGKARVIHQGQKVLLAVSGGSSSSAMLDLVIKGLDKAAVKKHRFQPGVIYIDDEGLCGQTVDDRSRIKNHIEELARSVGFPFHQVFLADLFLNQDKETCLVENMKVLDISNEEQNVSNEISKRTNRLKELFEKVTTMTAQEDLMSHLYRNQLQRVAKDNGYDYVMVGDCGTNIAIRILADIAQGRGSQLPFSVSFKDDRPEVPVLRPMREFTKKEIEFYNCFSNVTSFTIPSFTTKASSHDSVNLLTEELIFGLQASFPSTVNTVLKTGDKISSNVGDGNSEHCALCLAPLDVRCGFSKVFSELVTCESGGCGSGCQKSDGGGTYTGSGGSDGHSGSAGDGHGGCKKTDGSDDGGMCAGGGIGGNMVPEAHIGGDQNTDGADQKTGGGDQNTNDHNILLKSLCYGCNLTYHDIKDGQELLPKFVTDNARKQFQQRAMEGQIKDFLLDD